MKVLKNCHCANFRVCSKRQVFCHLFSWTCCIKVWNYWLKKTTTNFTMLSVQTVLLVSQYRIYIFIIHKIYMLHTFNMFCKCSFDRKEDHLPFFSPILPTCCLWMQTASPKTWHNVVYLTVRYETRLPFVFCIIKF